MTHDRETWQKMAYFAIILLEGIYSLIHLYDASQLLGGARFGDRFDGHRWDLVRSGVWEDVYA